MQSCNPDSGKPQNPHCSVVAADGKVIILHAIYCIEGHQLLLPCTQTSLLNRNWSHPFGYIFFYTPMTSQRLLMPSIGPYLAITALISLGQNLLWPIFVRPAVLIDAARGRKSKDNPQSKLPTAKLPTSQFWHYSVTCRPLLSSKVSARLRIGLELTVRRRYGTARRLRYG